MILYNSSSFLLFFLACSLCSRSLEEDSFKVLYLFFFRQSVSWSLNKKLSRQKFSNFSQTEAFWSHACSHFPYKIIYSRFSVLVGKTLITEVDSLKWLWNRMRA